MDTIAPTWLWFFFVAAVLAALFVDFVVLKKQGAHEVGVKEALNWSIVWVALSFAFNGLFWWAVAQDHGTAVANEKSMEFLTGYLIEKSLAVDNIFVFLLIFSYFAVPPAFQKRVLMIGIIGAIVLRTLMILLGEQLDAGTAGVIVVGVSDMEAKIKAAMKRAAKLEEKQLKADQAEIEKDAADA